MLLHRFRWILLAALAVHIVAAWFSNGYHAVDEHFQVIAFAEAKAGHEPVAGLPWEYAAQVRSALLPAVCMAVFGTARSFGIHDPLVLAFLLRLLTAFLALVAVTVFVRSTRHLVEQRFLAAYVLLSYLLWFLPFLHVRFTGETWSGSFLLLAVASLLAPKGAGRNFAGTGCLLGLAFLCRPPVLAAAAGMWLWLAVVERERIANMMRLLAGFSVVGAAGLALDSWFYGTFTVTAANYLRLGMLGTDHGVFLEYPWWYYYAWVFKYAIPLFGAAILLAFGALCALRPKHLLTWVLVPFLVFHMLVPHKELRFLYPLADLVILMVVLALQASEQQWPAIFRNLRQGPALAGAVVVAAVVNLGALAVVIFSPAGSGSTNLCNTINQRFPSGAVRLSYLEGKEAAWRIRVPGFYLREGISDTVITSACAPLPATYGRVELLVAHGPVKSCGVPGAVRWTPLLSALPPWKQMALKAYEWEDAKEAWILYQATPVNHK